MLPKRSYTLLFKPFDWIVGTGNYTDDIDKVIAEKKNLQKILIEKTIFSLVLFVFICLAVSAVFSVIIGRRITRPIISLMKKAEIVAVGDLTVSFGAKQTDEVGQLSRALEKMTKELPSLSREMPRRRAMGRASVLWHTTVTRM